MCLDKRNGGLGVRCLHSLNINIYIFGWVNTKEYKAYRCRKYTIGVKRLGAVGAKRQKRAKQDEKQKPRLPSPRAQPIKKVN